MPVYSPLIDLLQSIDFVLGKQPPKQPPPLPWEKMPLVLNQDALKKKLGQQIHQWAWPETPPAVVDPQFMKPYSENNPPPKKFLNAYDPYGSNWIGFQEGMGGPQQGPSSSELFDAHKNVWWRNSSVNFQPGDIGPEGRPLTGPMTVHTPPFHRFNLTPQLPNEMGRAGKYPPLSPIPPAGQSSGDPLAYDEIFHSLLTSDKPLPGPTDLTAQPPYAPPGGGVAGSDTERAINYRLDEFNDSFNAIQEARFDFSGANTIQDVERRARELAQNPDLSDADRSSIVHRAYDRMNDIESARLGRDLTMAEADAFPDLRDLATRRPGVPPPQIRLDDELRQEIARRLEGDLGRPPLPFEIEEEVRAITEGRQRFGQDEGSGTGDAGGEQPGRKATAADMPPLANRMRKQWLTPLPGFDSDIADYPPLDALTRREPFGVLGAPPSRFQITGAGPVGKVPTPEDIAGSRRALDQLGVDSPIVENHIRGYEKFFDALGPDKGFYFNPEGQLEYKPLNEMMGLKDDPTILPFPQEKLLPPAPGDQVIGPLKVMDETGISPEPGQRQSLKDRFSAYANQAPEFFDDPDLMPIYPEGYKGPRYLPRRGSLHDQGHAMLPGSRAIRDTDLLPPKEIVDLREKITKAGWTYKEVSNAAGVHPLWISRAYSRHSPVTEEKLTAMNEAISRLGVNPRTAGDVDVKNAIDRLNELRETHGALKKFGDHYGFDYGSLRASSSGQIGMSPERAKGILGALDEWETIGFAATPATAPIREPVQLPDAGPGVESTGGSLAGRPQEPVVLSDGQYADAFRQHIKQWIWSNGSTQRKLADRIGMHNNTLNNFLRGKTTLGPGFSRLLASETGASAELLASQPSSVVANKPATPTNLESLDYRIRRVSQLNTGDGLDAHRLELISKIIENGETVTTAAKKLGLHLNTLSNYLSGVSQGSSRLSHSLEDAGYPRIYKYNEPQPQQAVESSYRRSTRGGGGIAGPGDFPENFYFAPDKGGTFGNVPDKGTGEILRRPEGFADSFSRAIRAKGLKISDLAHELKVSQETVYNWKRGSIHPSPAQREKLKEVFKDYPEVVNSVDQIGYQRERAKLTSGLQDRLLKGDYNLTAVAERAAVNIATVSKIVNDPEYRATPETVSKITKALDDAGDDASLKSYRKGMDTAAQAASALRRSDAPQPLPADETAVKKYRAMDNDALSKHIMESRTAGSDAPVEAFVELHDRLRTAEDPRSARVYDLLSPEQAERAIEIYRNRQQPVPEALVTKAAGHSGRAHTKGLAGLAERIAAQRGASSAGPGVPGRHERMAPDAGGTFGNVPDSGGSISDVARFATADEPDYGSRTTFVIDPESGKKLGGLRIQTNDFRIPKGFKAIDFGEEPPLRLDDIKINESIRGRGIGQELFLQGMAHSPDKWYWNSQAFEPAVAALNALKRKGLIELHWGLGGEGGNYAARLTDKGKQYVSDSTNKPITASIDEDGYLKLPENWRGKKPGVFEGGTAGAQRSPAFSSSEPSVLNQEARQRRIGYQPKSAWDAPEVETFSGWTKPKKGFGAFLDEILGRPAPEFRRPKPLFGTGRPGIGFHPLVGGQGPATLENVSGTVQGIVGSAARALAPEAMRESDIVEAAKAGDWKSYENLLRQKHRTDSKRGLEAKLAYAQNSKDPQSAAHVRVFSELLRDYEQKYSGRAYEMAMHDQGTRKLDAATRSQMESEPYDKELYDELMGQRPLSQGRDVLPSNTKMFPKVDANLAYREAVSRNSRSRGEKEVDQESLLKSAREILPDRFFNKDGSLNYQRLLHAEELIGDKDFQGGDAEPGSQLYGILAGYAKATDESTKKLYKSFVANYEKDRAKRLESLKSLRESTVGFDDEGVKRVYGQSKGTITRKIEKLDRASTTPRKSLKERFLEKASV